MSTGFSTDSNTDADTDVAVNGVIEALRAEPGALLPILHGIQDRLGLIPPSVVPRIARELNLSRAEVHGVITFYHHFRQYEAGRVVIQVCRAEACQANGADALVAHAKQALQCQLHETTADGRFTLEPVYCLGHCAVGPAMLVGQKPYARVTAERFDGIVRSAREAL